MNTILWLKMYKIIHRIWYRASTSDRWLLTSWISTNLYSCCTNLLTDSSVPGTTVVIRESPSTSACPTAKLWRGNWKTINYEEHHNEEPKGYENLASVPKKYIFEPTWMLYPRRAKTPVTMLRTPGESFTSIDKVCERSPLVWKN